MWHFVFQQRSSVTIKVGYLFRRGSISSVAVGLQARLQHVRRLQSAFFHGRQSLGVLVSRVETH